MGGLHRCMWIVDGVGRIRRVGIFVVCALWMVFLLFGFYFRSYF